MSRRRNISPVGGVIGALQIQKSLTDFESLEFANSPEITLMRRLLLGNLGLMYPDMLFISSCEPLSCFRVCQSRKRPATDQLSQGLDSGLVQGQ